MHHVLETVFLTRRKAICQHQHRKFDWGRITEPFRRHYLKLSAGRCCKLADIVSEFTRHEGARGRKNSGGDDLSPTLIAKRVRIRVNDHPLRPMPRKLRATALSPSAMPESVPALSIQLSACKIKQVLKNSPLRGGADWPLFGVSLLLSRAQFAF